MSSQAGNREQLEPAPVAHRPAGKTKGHRFGPVFAMFVASQRASVAEFVEANFANNRHFDLRVRIDFSVALLAGAFDVEVWVSTLHDKQLAEKPRVFSRVGGYTFDPFWVSDASKLF